VVEGDSLCTNFATRHLSRRTDVSTHVTTAPWLVQVTPGPFRTASSGGTGELGESGSGSWAITLKAQGVGVPAIFVTYIVPPNVTRNPPLWTEKRLPIVVLTPLQFGDATTVGGPLDGIPRPATLKVTK
jgi:hypothetical protein